MGPDAVDPDYDVIVVGSGASGFSAAIVAASQGLRVAILEKSSYLGGTTAMSGGGIWIPANTLMLAAGQQDDTETAQAYVSAIAAPGDDAVLRAYLEAGPAALDYLRSHSDLIVSTRPRSPDYYSSLPSATSGSRAVDPLEFDGRKLGADLALIRPPRPESLLFGTMPVSGADIGHLRRLFRSPRSFAHVLGLLFTHVRHRLASGGDPRLVLGRALVGRMLKTARRLPIDIHRESPVLGLISEDDRIVGVQTVVGGRTGKISANYGVVLATGGFGRDRTLVGKWVPCAAEHIGVGAHDTTGDGIRLALAAGAHMSDDVRDSAFWTPVSKHRKPDGSVATFPHLVTDRAKPGMVAIDSRGVRFVNEADSYHDFVRAMHKLDPPVAFLVCDTDAMRRYGLGLARPWPFPRRHLVKDGYLLLGRTLAELAGKLGVDAVRFQSSIDRYNADAECGRDGQFGKGESAYNRFMGDPDHRPNPCLGPILRSPFYAVKLYPGNVGSSRGIRIDAHARVLDAQGAPVAGLYAVGNDADSIFRGSYPGPGASLGPALTGGYLAAMDIVDRAREAGAANVPEHGDFASADDC